MLRSMTGFGRCLVENARVAQQWEIKSVNSRYLDLKWRLPALVRYLEPVLERVIRKEAGRGRVEISLSLQFPPGRAPKPAFDVERADAMLKSVEKLAARRGEKLVPDYGRLLAIPDLWGEPQIEETEDLADILRQGLGIVLDDWNESRETEGRYLGQDLLARVELMQEWLTVLSQSAPNIREEKIATLRERLDLTLEGLGHELEDGRFLQEIVLLADRIDVSEELTRLRSHLDRMGQLLREGGEIGRKLDFTLQEAFREINTCGNKLQDADLSRIVVNFKNELEKCREQAQNLE